MTGVLAHPPAPEDGADTETWRALQGVTGLLSGWTDWSVPVPLTGVSDDATHAVTIDNRGTGGHLLIPGQVDVTDGGTQITSLVAGTIAVTTLDATTANIATLNVSGVSALHATSTTALTATGNVALGDANADTITMIGVTTVRNAANTAIQAFFDPGNNRVIVGSGTALGSDTTPNLQVVGRLYVAPETANDFALEIRRSSATTVGWRVGVESTNDMIFKDDAGTSILRMGDIASTYQLDVAGTSRLGLLVTTGTALIAGAMTVNGGMNVTGTVAVTGGITATTSIAATGGMSAGASSSFTGGVSVVSGGLTVIAGGAAVTGGTTTDTLVVTSVMRTDSSANKILHTGAGAKGTADTTGYVWIPYSLGKPTGNPGTPTGSSGALPIQFDGTNNKLVIWNGAAWLSSGVFA